MRRKGHFCGLGPAEPSYGHTFMYYASAMMMWQKWNRSLCIFSPKCVFTELTTIFDRYTVSSYYDWGTVKNQSVLRVRLIRSMSPLIWFILGSNSCTISLVGSSKYLNSI